MWQRLPKAKSSCRHFIIFLSVSSQDPVESWSAVSEVGLINSRAHLHLWRMELRVWLSKRGGCLPDVCRRAQRSNIVFISLCGSPQQNSYFITYLPLIPRWFESGANQCVSQSRVLIGGVQLLRKKPNNKQPELESESWKNSCSRDTLRSESNVYGSWGWHFLRGRRWGGIMARCLEWCDASHPPVWNLSSCFCTSEPAVTIITALNLGGVGIGPWHFLFVWENFRSRQHLNVCTLVQRCRKASEQRKLSLLNRRCSCHSVRTEDAGAAVCRSITACLIVGCLLAVCCTIPTVCLWSEDLWYNEETPLEVKKWTVIVMILQDKWTGYIRSLIPVWVAPRCTCTHAFILQVIRW